MKTTICGNAFAPKKSCEQCKRVLRWGVSTTYCLKDKENHSEDYHCKYYKREQEIFTKDAKIKNMDLYNELYA